MKEVQSKKTSAEWLSWLTILIVTVGAFFVTYYYHLAGPMRAVVWVIWLLCVFGLAYLTTQGKQVFVFAKEAKVELLKVVWPNRQETIQTTSIVMIMVAITGFVLWGIDSAMLWAISRITHLG